MPDEKDVAYDPVSRRRCLMFDVTEALLRRNYSGGSRSCDARRELPAGARRNPVA
jgi:hypothetical protein